MTSSHSSNGWTDDLDTARSVPIDGLRALASEHQLVFIGELALELCEYLGFKTPTPFSFPYLVPWLGILNAWASYPAPRQIEQKPKADIIVLLDRWRFETLSSDSNYLKQLCMSLNAAVIFPARVRSRPVSIQWGAGFSWPESFSDKSWIWCDAVNTLYAEALLHNDTNDSLAIRLKFSCISFGGQPRSVIFSLNGSHVESTSAPSDIEVCVDIPPGENKLIWTADGTSHVDLGERNLSFAVCDFQVLDARGAIILDRDVAYEVPRESVTEIDDLLLRKRLHAAGFVSVGGVFRNGHGFPRTEIMPKTTGSPTLARPFDHDRNQWFYVSQSKPNDIAWFVASPLVGGRFDMLISRLSNDI